MTPLPLSRDRLSPACHVFVPWPLRRQAVHHEEDKTLKAHTNREEI
jgi:hypothetical protein